MKNVINWLTLLLIVLISSCVNIDEQEAIKVSNQIFSCIQERKWTMFHDIYPDSKNFDMVYRFTKFNIKKIEAENGWVKVQLDVDYKLGLNSNSKEVILFLEEKPDKKTYFIKDSKGLILFNDIDTRYLCTKMDIEPSEMQDLSDVEPAKAIVELKDIKEISISLCQSVKN